MRKISFENCSREKQLKFVGEIMGNDALEKVKCTRHWEEKGDRSVKVTPSNMLIVLV